MKRIESILRQEIGLDPASIGNALIERAVRLRMKECGCETLDDFVGLLTLSVAERMELIESVVVAESWFFRDPDAFTAFIGLVGQRGQRQDLGGVLRILSIPCASGEEPYSLIMALMEKGMPVARFQIDGIDVSARALAKAQRAVYSRNSFRGNDLSFRDRYFRETEDGFTLNSTVCACARFERANILSNKFTEGRVPYDYIFCRNLLIYFDRATQAAALDRLRELLTENGVIFVGPAELPILLDHGFAPLNLPMAFACCKTASAQTVRFHHKPKARLRRSAAKSPAAPAFTAPNGRAPVALVEKPGVANTTDLTDVQKLADAGLLDEAVDACESYVRQRGPSAQAFYLLGLVHDAKGAPTAADFYRKAIYLEPDHFESLWHLALLLEKNGDVAEAQTFKRRAERANTKQRKTSPVS